MIASPPGPIATTGQASGPTTVCLGRTAGGVTALTAASKPLRPVPTGTSSAPDVRCMDLGNAVRGLATNSPDRPHSMPSTARPGAGGCTRAVHTPDHIAARAAHSARIPAQSPVNDSHQPGKSRGRDCGTGSAGTAWRNSPPLPTTHKGKLSAPLIAPASLRLFAFPDAAASRGNSGAPPAPRHMTSSVFVRT